MPTYRYECQSCGHGLELFQSMTEKPRRKCPDCGKPKLQRLIGAGAGVIFKGSGFYETDYRSSSYKAAEKAAGTDTKAGGDSGAGGGSTGGKAADAAPATPKRAAEPPAGGAPAKT